MLSTQMKHCTEFLAEKIIVVPPPHFFLFQFTFFFKSVNETQMSFLVSHKNCSLALSALNYV